VEIGARVVLGRMGSVSVNGIPVLRTYPETVGGFLVLGADPVDNFLVLGTEVTIEIVLEEDVVWGCDVRLVCVPEDRELSDLEMTGSIFLLGYKVLVKVVGLSVLLSDPLLVL
jgi:hypothetical protein